MQRLQDFGEKHACRLGAKFTNTLVVKNHEKVFSDEVQYLSGPPLHVLSMNSMPRFRQAMGDDFHISFSAGIAKHNFADAVRCNMKPVTVCTDLLKTGGYARLFDYLSRLRAAMQAEGCASLQDFVGTPAEAAQRTEEIVAKLAPNPVYHFDKNKKAPRKIGSRLELFDCLSCDKCLSVCPNAANFSYAVEPQTIEFANYRFENGQFVPDARESLKIEKATQIGNFADFCNECGDCDTYCPEDGGPFIQKPRFFFSRESYDQFRRDNGFYFKSESEMLGTFAGQEFVLLFDKENRNFSLTSGETSFVFDSDNNLGSHSGTENFADEVPLAAFVQMRLIFEAMLENTGNYGASILTYGKAKAKVPE